MGPVVSTSGCCCDPQCTWVSELVLQGPHLEHQNRSIFNFFSGIIGSYLTEEQAARAHDLAALKYWGTGPNTKLNFNVRSACCSFFLRTVVSFSRTHEIIALIDFTCYQISDYEKEIEVMKTMSQDEFVAYIRRSVIQLESYRFFCF